MKRTPIKNRSKPMKRATAPLKRKTSLATKKTLDVGSKELKRKTPLRANATGTTKGKGGGLRIRSALKTGKPLERGAPIKDPNRAKLIRQAKIFHDEVFALFGGTCVFCLGPGATVAAHVIPKSALGRLRYAHPRLARPAHWDCHDRQTRNEIRFARHVIEDAAKARDEARGAPRTDAARTRKQRTAKGALGRS